MARIFITGSADGLGLMAAEILTRQGHAVTLHARNEHRAGDARRTLPSAEAVVTGDLATIAGMRRVAARPGHPGLASGRRRSRRHGDRQLLLPSAVPEGTSRR